jgi:hypothetical protein
MRCRLVRWQLHVHGGVCEKHTKEAVWGKQSCMIHA